MRQMFGVKLNLEECVGLNAIFLRSPNIAAYNHNLTLEERIRVRSFCCKRVERIIEALNPRRIVTIGLSTLNLFGPTTIGIASPRGRVLTRKGKIGERDALAMLHPTGARISNGDRARIAESVLANQ